MRKTIATIATVLSLGAIAVAAPNGAAARSGNGAAAVAVASAPIAAGTGFQQPAQIPDLHAAPYLHTAVHGTAL